ncbi:hypothetical protein lerEdw1_009079 [Lerista edwardsae]|nr:hypothetical protein lerEdw1_009079 [Lerista edwardsae]
MPVCLYTCSSLSQALDLIAAESSPVHNSVPTCSVGKGLFNDVCCDFCPPGTVVNHGCTETLRVSCKHCTKGADYMDHPNLNLKCLRCSLCDTEHGLEVEENCTVYQNVKCRCQTGFFCGSEQCHHCNPCDTCEDGAIEKDCTQTQNTVCRSKGKQLCLANNADSKQRNCFGLSHLSPVSAIQKYTASGYADSIWNSYYLEQNLTMFSVTGSLRWLWLLLPLALLLVLLVMIWRYYAVRKRAKKVLHHPVSPSSANEERIELEVQHFPDIDLSPLISDIAEEMTKKAVLMFVSKQGITHGVIDAFIQDHLNNTAELKMALLRKWYEKNGIRGAHEKLIDTLKKLDLRSMADKVEQKIISAAQDRR